MAVSLAFDWAALTWPAAIAAAAAVAVCSGLWLWDRRRRDTRTGGS